MNNEKLPMNDEQWTKINDQRKMTNEWWMNNEQWIKNNEHESIINEQWTINNE